MGRKTRGRIVNLVLFGLALSLLLYLNYSPRDKRGFAWKTVRYKTTSATLPEVRGVCPGLDQSLKPALIVARVSNDDSEWLDALSDKYHLCVYPMDEPMEPTSTHLQVPANRGHEAMAYLTFLIDNYAHIPVSGAVFVHGARWAWHNDALDYDNAVLLASLNVSSALAPMGYHNLRCDWSAGTCSPSDAPPQGSMETQGRALLEPRNTRVTSDAALPRALAALFGDGDTSTKAKKEKILLGRNDAVRAQCCAQFVVARERVWQHSRDEYIALRQWLLDGSSNKGIAAPLDDRVAGRVMSYVWHILFLQQTERGNRASSLDVAAEVDLEKLNRLACPHAGDCYCRLYGRCNLKGCTTPGRCQGQYHLPHNYRVPKL